MHIEQNFVARKQRAEPICDVIFKVLWLARGREVAIQIAIAVAASMGVSQWIGDGYKRHLASNDADLTALDVAKNAPDRDGPADLVAVHAAGDDEFVTRLQPAYSTA